jgi:hypothetical protein
MRKTLFQLFILLLVSNIALSQEPNERSWERKRIDAWVSTVGGQTYQGQILAARESQMALWLSKDPFELDDVEGKVIILDPKEISVIRLRRKSQLLRGLGLGAGIGVTAGAGAGAVSEPGFLGRAFNVVLGGVLVGIPSALIGGIAGATRQVNEDINLAGDESLYLEILPVIQKRYALQEAEIIDQIVSPLVSDTTSDPIEGISPDNSFSIARFHFGGGLGLNFSGLGNASMKAFEQAGMNVNTNVNDINYLGYGVDLMANLNRNLRLGLSFQTGSHHYIGGIREFSDTGVSAAIGGEEQSLQSTFGMTLDYVPRPVRKIMVNRWEYFVGGGIVLNRVESSSHFRGSGSRAAGGMTEFFSWDERGQATNFIQPGVQLRAGLDYYLLPYLSLYGQLSGTLAAGGSVLGNKIDPVPLSYPSQGLDNHQMNGSNWGVLFGVRFHLQGDNF